jgi:hypothetical protein
MPARRPAALLALVCAVACRSGSGHDVPPVNALIVAGDSTFWVQSDTGGVHVRRSPILLARYGERFYEVYVTDDDRSFYDAVIDGQRIFRRDIVSGDSVLMFEDLEVAKLAQAYARAHPDQHPLGPDEDEAEHPSLVATTETDIVGVVGPFVTFEQTADMEHGRKTQLHEVHRSVIDLRTGRIVGLDDLATDSVVQRVLHEGRQAVKVAFDSVRKSRDERASQAAQILDNLVFNATSFSLVVANDSPAIAFYVPGRGARAGGYALPLPPLAIPPGDWWKETRSALPSESLAKMDVWKGARADLIARYDSGNDDALIQVRSRRGREWNVTRIPSPVERLHWLDGPDGDTITLKALSRAFDEAALPAGGVRLSVLHTRRSLWEVANK